MLHNKKGAALLQVLLVTAVLAGMATMLLRASLSRTTSARRTHRIVSSQLLIENCQAEVNALWSAKTPSVFKRDLSKCAMRCVTSSCTGNKRIDSHECISHEQDWDGDGNADVIYTVTATFKSTSPTNGVCELEYSLGATDGSGNDLGDPEVYL